jgi:hypothetical protein
VNEAAGKIKQRSVNPVKRDEGRGQELKGKGQQLKGKIKGALGDDIVSRARAAAAKPC